MQLPKVLQSAIDEMIGLMNQNRLSEAREELTRSYRQPAGSQYMMNDAHRQAYIFSRMPATYAAIHASLKAINERGDWQFKSVLDLGAGPGTALWAVSENLPGIEKATLIERDSSLVSMGKRMVRFSDLPILRDAHWVEADLEQLQDLPPHDLIILSYSIGELNPSKMVTFIDLCWKSAQKLLLVIEPGTPVGFERILAIRKQLIERGAHLAAPCPHQASCPMKGADWCHFSARVERSSLHRKLKGGSLSYEDEKFSYIAASKTPVSFPTARILSHPSIHSGHLILKLCTEEGVKSPTLSKKMGDPYKKARKAEWGDSI